MGVPSGRVHIRKHVIPYLQEFGKAMGLTGLPEIVNRIIEDHQAFHLQNGRSMVAVSPITQAIAPAPADEPTYSPELDELIESDFAELLEVE